MKSFFSSFFASLLAMVVAFFLILIIFSAIAVGVVSSMENKEKVFKPKEHSVLKINFNKPIVDRNIKNPLGDLDFGNFSSKSSMGLDAIVKNLEKAKNDEKIEGILLNFSGINAGFASLQEIRRALLNFKKSGKWIVSYSEMLSQSAYYLASTADKIYLYPEGGMDFKGLRTEIMFFKGALDKLEIEPQIIRGKNNKFKSAMEPFMYDHMSDANKEQVETFLGSIWQQLLTEISMSRGISIGELNKIADNISVQNAREAVTHKMADKILYNDELITEIKERLGTEEDINYAKFSKYFDAKDHYKKRSKEAILNKTKIAIIYAIGSIESGEGDDKTIGSDRIAKAIKIARLDTNVKAIVMRVNSPGGSALASDVIWREVQLAKKEKPFIVSMGDVAASGGYYISCAADRIFAEQNTITGSIGVFGVMPNLKGLFNNKLGITFDGVTTNAHSDMMTTSRPLDDFEHSKVQEGVEDVYHTFVSNVAEGRGMTFEQVDAIGQGRVWAGTDAKRIGLIDEFGGMEAALAFAAQKANIEDYKILNLPKVKNPFESIINEISGKTEAKIMEIKLGDNYKYYQYLQIATQLKGTQMRLPYAFNIK